LAINFATKTLTSSPAGRCRLSFMAMGERLAGNTVTLNSVATAALPSLTITLTVVTPVCPEVEVMESVRLAPEPPKRKADFGNRPGFADRAVTVSESADT
jgi:hypothetical protein